MLGTCFHVLPCDEVQKVASTSHDLVLEILQHQEKKEDLKRILEEQGHILLTKEELKDIKLEARRRGREEAEASCQPREGTIKEIVQTAWLEGLAQPMPGKWAPIPQQLTIGNKLIAFDLWMQSRMVCPIRWWCPKGPGEEPPARSHHRLSPVPTQPSLLQQPLPPQSHILQLLPSSQPPHLQLPLLTALLRRSPCT